MFLIERDLFGNLALNGQIKKRKVVKEKTNKSAKKLYRFKGDILTKELKKDIMSLFRISVNQRNKDYADNYTEVKKYKRAIKIYDKERDLYKEIKSIPIGTPNWFNELSYNFQKYLLEVEKREREQEYDRVTSLMSEPLFNARYDLIKQQAESKLRYDLFDRDWKELNNYALERYVTGSKMVEVSHVDIYKRVLKYALEHKLEWFNIVMTDIEEEIYQKYVVDRCNLPLTIKDKIKMSINRSIGIIKDLCFCNLEKFEKFVTLTFAPEEKKEKHIRNNARRQKGEHDLKLKYIDDITNYEQCVKAFSKFMTNLRNILNRKDIDLYYIAIPEYCKNGAIHYHLLISKLPDELLYEVPGWLDYDNKIGKRRYDIGITTWKHGKSAIEDIKSKKRVVTYISKYLIKSLNEISETEYLDRLNKKRYYPSRNLIKPKINYENKEIKNYVDEYKTDYFNYYNGSTIESSLYQLKKFEEKKEVDLWNTF